MQGGGGGGGGGTVVRRYRYSQCLYPGHSAMEQSTAQIAYGVVVDEESGVGMDRVEPSGKSSQVVVTQVSVRIG